MTTVVERMFHVEVTICICPCICICTPQSAVERAAWLEAIQGVKHRLEERPVEGVGEVVEGLEVRSRRNPPGGLRLV